MYKKIENIEEVKKVKYELDKYNYHVIEIEKINDKLKMIDHKLLGLPKGIKSDPGGRCNTNDVKIALTRKKDYLLKERDMHYIHIQLCDSIIDSCNKQMKEIIIDKFKNDMNYASLMIKYNMSYNALSHRIDKEIHRVMSLKKEALKQKGVDKWLKFD